MEPLQTGTLVSTHHRRSRAHSLAQSALPDAPVIPYAPRSPRAARPRRAVATALHRVADAVAPSPANAAGRPGRRAYAGGRAH